MHTLSMNTPIICAGFHRSGTSLASQILHMSGLPFAIEEMPGSISNPDGHFEDLFTMRMHDEFLSSMNTSWQFHGEVDLAASSANQNQIQSYCKLRDRIHGDAWLVKDPRATLFLDEWKSALNGRGRFLLVYRHWSLCLQSLYKRHSLDLISSISSNNRHAINEYLNFWVKPELAAKMWLAYNRELIKFVRQNPLVCVIVSQEQLVSGYDLISCLNTNFDMNLNSIGSSPVKNEYFDESVNSIVFDNINEDLQAELNSVYFELESIHHGGSNLIIPKTVSKPLATTSENLVKERILSLKREVKVSASSCSESKGYEFDETHIAGLGEHELLKILRAIDVRDVNSIEYIKSLANRLLDIDPFRFSGHEWLARALLLEKQYKAAEVHLLRAISLDGSPPYLKMLLAELFLSNYDFKSAKYYFKLAYKGNPKNPNFSVKLGDVEFFEGQLKKALNHYQEANRLKESDWVKIKIVNVEERISGVDKALSVLKSFSNFEQSLVLKSKYLTLSLKGRKRDSVNLYREFVGSESSRKDVAKFFDLVKEKALSDEEIGNLAYWLALSSRKCFSDESIYRLFTKEVGVSPKQPRLSIVVISYNMSRELPRTVRSLLPPYQRNVANDDIEILVVDNGSSVIPKLTDFVPNNNVRIISNPTDTQSPVDAINLGLNLTKSDFVGVMIDGARMVSPGLCEQALNAYALSDRTVISTLGFHLGPEVQMKSVPKGYNQELENQILDSIDWVNNGYRLFEISSLAGSSANGYFKPIAESNALFMSKPLWSELKGYDNRFKTPGGGFSNLDLYKRACELPDTKLAILLNEGTFHQVHGGVATNSQREDATPKIYSDEYKTIRGELFSVPDKEAIYIGRYIEEGAKFLKRSLTPGESSVNQDLHELNRKILKASNCEPFDTAQTINEDVIDSPVIITGRGGSGTRLLSQLMQGMDIFLGNDINETQDSVEWVGPIYDLVVQDWKVGNGEFREEHARRLRNNALNILTRGGYSSGLWGFKLPETILCLPELKKAFPNARFIHLVRHPVSISLRRSHMTSRRDNPIGKKVLRDAFELFGDNLGNLDIESDYISNAVSWKFQLTKALEFFKDEDEGSYITVKYEDILSSPESVNSELCAFLNIDSKASHDLLLDASRANAQVKESKDSEWVWGFCGEVASKFGY